MATTTIGAPGVVFPDGTTQASASPGTVVTRIYASPSPWTKPADLKAVRVTVLGGGGGGGGAKGSTQSLTAGGGGGAAGGFGYFQAPAIPGPVTVSVGAAGQGAPAPATPATATTGTSGGTSSFGSLITATGGAGGGPAAGAAGAFTSIPQGRGFAGLGGGPGGNPKTGASNSIEFGGNSFQNWGFGGLQTTPGAGGDGTGYGSGGSGATGSVPAPRAGGDGRVGFVIVEEFY